MKAQKNLILTLLLALLCFCLLRSQEALTETRRLWVGGVELSQGGSLAVGDGTAVYDPATRTLTLTDMELSGAYQGAAIYAESDLIILLCGHSSLSGTSTGATVLGSLTVYGGGSLTLSGHRSGAAIRDCLAVFDRSAVTLCGLTPLRWGRIHASPMAELREDPGRLSVRAPYTATFLDGDLDAAGHLLSGRGLFQRQDVKLGQPVPPPSEPERAGYWFGGWFADPELTEIFDFSLPRDESVTLYARWIQIVRLSFDPWGGGDIPAVETAWGDPAPTPETPQRTGYRFAGWYEDDMLLQPLDLSAPQTLSRMVYARWDKVADKVAAGIDVARYQGQIDWQTVKAAGTEFVFLRAGFRGYGAEGTLNTDDNFERNYQGAREAGLDVGVYFFSQATDPAEARAEADYVLALLDGRTLTLPVVMDYELASDASGALLGRLYEADLDGGEHAQNCLTFCQAVEEAGYTAAVYAGKSMLEDTVGDALAEAGYPVWLANWTVQTRYNGAYEYWQTSGSGYVDGIEGPVDLDLRYIQTPSQITGLTLKQGEDFNFLYWDRVPGVTGYIIYRSVPQGGGYGELARRSGAAAVTFTDYGAPDGCKYLVCAYVTQSGSEYRGPFSDAAS